MQTVSDILKTFNPLEDKYISREFQSYGIHLAEALEDMKHKALYIRLAKTVPRAILEKARGVCLEWGALHHPSWFTQMAHNASTGRWTFFGRWGDRDLFYGRSGSVFSPHPLAISDDSLCSFVCRGQFLYRHFVGKFTCCRTCSFVVSFLCPVANWAVEAHGK